MTLSKHAKALIFIVFISLASLYIVLPDQVGKFKVPRFNVRFLGRDFSKSIDIKQGLDIKGGVQVTLSADMSKIPDNDKNSAMESLKEVVSRRVDMFGVSESSVKTLISGGEYRLLLELPGVTDSKQALALIGQTAQLNFATPVFKEGKTATESATLVDFKATGLTGADLKKASVTFETEDRSPAVSLQFSDEGKTKFAKLTRENIGKEIYIFIDDTPITHPTVQTEIIDGNAIISGSFTLEDAKSLTVQLNAGALPVPVSVLSQKNIPATLGADSIKKSLISGAVGLSMVVIFMTLYYGRLGLIASFSLMLYGLYTLALYKLIPVVLSLPGIAGFLLSVGMAVDSNILIFERYKEEIRAGRPWQVALELAFGRAWDSIKDANTATIITGLILFNPLNWSFLNTSGSVRGFALTLILGIIISLFTGLVVTRNLLRVFFKGKNQQVTSKKL